MPQLPVGVAGGLLGLAACRWALDAGFPTRVTSAGGRFHDADDWEAFDTQMITAEFEGGKLITWDGRSCNPFPVMERGRGVTIHGTEGTVLLDRDGWELYDLKDKKIDEFVVQLTDKREEVYNAFDSRKVQLVEARNQRTAALQNAAERILKGIKSRVETLSSINEIHGYFASDLMIEKVRGLVAQLQELGDTVKADDIQSRLKTVREDAVRQLKDRQELFVEGEMVIRLGQHRFSVNAQPLDLTTVFRDGQMLLHLTGTNFFQPIEDQALLAAREVWDQQIVSENREVYRAEYLAFQFLGELYRPMAEGAEKGSGVFFGQRAERQGSDQLENDSRPLFNGQGDDQPENAPHPLGSGLTAKDLLACDDRQLTAHLQRFMGPRYEEAYSKGVHDHDAAILLRALLEMKTTIGWLRFQTRARAMARVSSTL